MTCLKRRICLAPTRSRRVYHTYTRSKPGLYLFILSDNNTEHCASGLKMSTQINCVQTICGWSNVQEKRAVQTVLQTWKTQICEAGGCFCLALLHPSVSETFTKWELDLLFIYKRKTPLNSILFWFIHKNNLHTQLEQNHCSYQNHQNSGQCSHTQRC